MSAWLNTGEPVAIRSSTEGVNHVKGTVLVARGDASLLELEDGRRMLVPNDEVAVRHDGKWAWAHEVR